MRESVPRRTATTRPRKWRLPVVWLVPLVAAVLAGYLLKVESFRALLAGGVAFATPPAAGPGEARLAQGTAFSLFDKPQPEWLEWAPHIALAP